MELIDRNFEIRRSSDLIKVSIFIKEILANYPSNFKDSVDIATSELATNILKHAGRGELKILFDNEKFVMKTFNIGRLSILDFIDGTTNKNTLGIGLGVAGRSADEFYYKLNPVEITWIKYLNVKILNKFDIATKLEPIIFGGCGDRIVKIELPSFIFIALLDVAGHGREAGEVAKSASKFIDNHYYLELNDLMECLVEYMKNIDRRLVIEFLKLWKTKDQLEFCGIGDVSCKIFYNTKKINRHYLFRDDHETLLMKRGVLGGVKQDWMKDFNIIKREIPKGSFIIMFSDGISSSIIIDPDHFNKNSQDIIDQIFNKYKREDDRALAIIKCK
jgi:anti-sigma regulatory factor (Ser/Thr protein kinase)